METVIRLKPEELTISLLKKIKLLISDNKEFEIIISVREKTFPDFLYEESPGEYLNNLNRSINEMEQGKVVSFSLQEFEKYVKENFSE